MSQIDDAQLLKLIDPDANSIALIMKHVAGNMRSRWTDFLTTDGEKPDRDRDTEFEMASGDTQGIDSRAMGGGMGPAARRNRIPPGGGPWSSVTIRGKSAR